MGSPFVAAFHAATCLHLAFSDDVVAAQTSEAQIFNANEIALFARRQFCEHFTLDQMVEYGAARTRNFFLITFAARRRCGVFISDLCNNHVM